MQLQQVDTKYLYMEIYTYNTHRKYVLQNLRN